MVQVFSPRANTIARLSLLLAVLGLVGFLVLMDALHRFSYGTDVEVPRSQPIPFSHKHHVNMAIDCRCCHAHVPEAAFAGIPAPKNGIKCLSMVFSVAPVLEAVRES